MKRIFTSGFLGLVISGLLLASCSQMASYENEDLTLEQASADKAGFKLNPFGSSINLNAREYVDDACSTDCITEEEETWFVKEYTEEYDTDETVTIEIYNTPTHIVYSFTSSEDIKKIEFNGSVLYASNTAAIQPFVHEVPLSNGWEGCDVEEAAITVRKVNSNGVGTGQIVRFNTSYNLVPVCVTCDEADFDYETVDNQNIVFSYNHGEEVESVTIAFTFPQIMNMTLNEDDQYVAPDGKIYEVNNPTNQTVFTWTGFVSCDAEEAETFTFAMTPDCSAPPANDGQALVWTDAKVIAVNGEALVDDLETPENEGPYSLKGGLSNIVYEGCPTTK